MASRRITVRRLNPYDRYLEICDEVTDFCREVYYGILRDEPLTVLRELFNQFRILRVRYLDDQNKLFRFLNRISSHDGVRSLTISFKQEVDVCFMELKNKIIQLSAN